MEVDSAASPKMSFTSDKDPSALALEHACEKAAEPFEALGCELAAAMEWLGARMRRQELASPPESNLAETQACAKFVLTKYNIRAAAFCRLVSTDETRNAFSVLLDCFEHIAWYEFAEIGGPQELPPGTRSIATGIERRKRWWTRQAHERLASSAATGGQYEDGGTPSSFEHRSNPNLISGKSAALDFISDLSTSLNRISADSPDYEIWKAFCLKNHDAKARYVVHIALHASKKKPSNPKEAMKLALRIFDSAATAKIALVSDLESAAGCEIELRKLVGGCLDYMEAFLAQTGRCRAVAKWRSKLELELVRRFARGKRRALKAAKQQTIAQDKGTALPQGLKRRGPPTQPDCEPPESEMARRAALLRGYKSATDQPSNKRIYEASNSGIHKPEFYDWVNGKLPAGSSTAQNFERFLREKKRPIPRKLQN